MAKAEQCPNCGSSHIDEFYSVDNIPIHSVLLMDTRDEAKSYPRRNLRLGFCSACCFIYNTIFNPSLHEYSPTCEETQSCSSTFNQFSRELARRWVEDYDLQGKSILEVGCGKGEFLAQMVEYGAGKGYGIDPAYVPGRLDSPAIDKLKFYQELYGEQQAAKLKADAVCCRHTLEHIGPVRDFVQTIVDSHKSNPETVFLFELPDGKRVIEEAAFWDIYYEHCSYFSAGALARLFRSFGLQLNELQYEYNDQYLTICASGNSGKMYSIENDVGIMKRLVDEFPDKVGRCKELWRSRLDKWRRQGKKVALWGGGSKAVAFSTTLGLDEHDIATVIDINPRKQGKFLPGSGLAVEEPEQILAQGVDVTVVMNPVYTDEIRILQGQIGRSTELFAV